MIDDDDAGIAALRKRAERRARLDASGNQIHRQARIRQAEAATADGAAQH